LIINRDSFAAALAKTEGKRSNVLTFKRFNVQRLIKKKEIPNLNFQIPDSPCPK